MKLIKGTSKKVLVEFDLNELGTIGNALNEVCNGINIAEFSTRMGATQEEVEKLLAEVIEIYRDFEDLS